jgi:hypothetical protein
MVVSPSMVWMGNPSRPITRYLQGKFSSYPTSLSDYQRLLIFWYLWCIHFPIPFPHMKPGIRLFSSHRKWVCRTGYFNVGLWESLTLSRLAVNGRHMLNGQRSRFTKKLNSPRSIILSLLLRQSFRNTILDFALGMHSMYRYNVIYVFGVLQLWNTARLPRLDVHWISCDTLKVEIPERPWLMFKYSYNVCFVFSIVGKRKWRELFSIWTM